MLVNMTLIRVVLLITHVFFINKLLFSLVPTYKNAFVAYNSSLNQILSSPFKVLKVFHMQRTYFCISKAFEHFLNVFVAYKIKHSKCKTMNLFLRDERANKVYQKHLHFFGFILMKNYFFLNSRNFA